MSAKALIAGAGICLSVAVVLLLVLIRQPSDEMVASEFAPRTIQYRFHVQNTGNLPVDQAYLLVHAPLDETGAQRCTHIDASHPFFEMIQCARKICKHRRSQRFLQSQRQFRI